MTDIATTSALQASLAQKMTAYATQYGGAAVGEFVAACAPTIVQMGLDELGALQTALTNKQNAQALKLIEDHASMAELAAEKTTLAKITVRMASDKADRVEFWNNFIYRGLTLALGAWCFFQSELEWRLVRTQLDRDPAGTLAWLGGILGKYKKGESMLAFLNGKKTYIIMALTFIAGGLEACGVHVPEAVWPVLGALGMGAVGHAAHKAEQAAKDSAE